MERVRKAAAFYYTMQGIAIFAWWAMLFAAPETRRYFQLQKNSADSLMAFFAPDVLLLGVGSIATAVLVYFGIRYAEAAMWLVTGSLGYATVYTFAVVFATDTGWLGVSLMLPAMLWSGVFATGITVGNTMFRHAKASSTNYVVLKTFVQIVVVWSVILLIFPYLITILQDKLGIVRLEFAFQKPLAIILFVLVSSIGVWSAYVMSKIGRGTPLPLDHAHELVIAGPYRFVRNPMAVSGVGQGLMVALFLGSPLVAIYALMGSAIWQFIFRPLEEDDLAARFDEEYESYRREVKCWVPRLTPYQIDGTVDSSNSIASPSGSM